MAAAALPGPLLYTDVSGENTCAGLAAHLVRHSRAFHVEPRPGNVWRFWLKDEPGNALILPGTVKSFRPRPARYA